MAAAGFAEVQVQRFGAATDVMLRLPPQAAGTDPNAIRDSLRNTLAADEPNVDLRRVEFVGPQVGEELTEQGGLAMIFALLLIFAYVMFRFQWKFSLGAVAALAHDVIVTIGVFSFFQLPFDLTVVAAVLADRRAQILTPFAIRCATHWLRMSQMSICVEWSSLARRSAKN